VPQFRVRQDVVPGMDIKAWFQPTVVARTRSAAPNSAAGSLPHAGAGVRADPRGYDAWMKQLPRRLAMTTLPRRRTAHTAHHDDRIRPEVHLLDRPQDHRDPVSCSSACLFCWSGIAGDADAVAARLPGQAHAGRRSAARDDGPRGVILPEYTSSSSRCTARSWCSSPSCRCSSACSPTS